MPKRNKVRNPVIDRLLIQGEKLDRAMSTIKPIPKGTYKERNEFHGKGVNSADYQGPHGGLGGMGYFPGTNDLMPGTTPFIPEPKPGPLDKLLEILKIKPKRERRKPMEIPQLKHPGFM